MPKLMYDFNTSDSAILKHFSDATSEAIRYEKVELSGDQGTSSLKMVVDRHEHQNKVPHRSDLQLKPRPQIPLGQKVEYRFKFRFSNRWVPDPIHPELFAQWLPDDRSSGGPCLAFYLRHRRCSLSSNNPTREPPFQRHISSVLDYIQVDPIEHRWTELSLLAKWSTGNDGRLIVSRDGTVIETINGQNCDNTKFSPYFKFGPYKWGWSDANRTEITRRVVYFQYVSIEW